MRNQLLPPPPFFFFSTFSLEILRVRRAYIFLIFYSFSCASGATGEESVGSARRIVGDGTSPSPGTVPKVDLPR